VWKNMGLPVVCSDQNAVWHVDSSASKQPYDGGRDPPREMSNFRVDKHEHAQACSRSVYKGTWILQ